MICQNCLDAGAENSLAEYKRAAKFHKKCDFKGCVCQHKTGPGFVKRVKEESKPDQSQ